MPLRFDFFINNSLLIEYDGEQHFFPVYGEDAFKTTIKHDDIKNKYTKENNIRLFRIPYWKKKNITKILETILNTKDFDNEKDNLYLSFEASAPKKVQRLSWK